MDSAIFELLTDIVGQDQILVDEPMKIIPHLKSVDRWILVLPKNVKEIKGIVNL